jgi:hypothetical protein
VAPGYSVRDGSYPKLYGLYSDLRCLRLVGAFFPIGCALQDSRASNEVYDTYEYSEASLDAMREIDEISGGFRCRDQKIVNMLSSKGIRANYIGDLALYDELKLFRPFVPPKKIRSVVYTVQHKSRYRRQSFSVLKLIKELFPTADLYVAHHSSVSDESRIVGEFAANLGFVEVDLSGDVEKLSFYDSIDMHIGYRLHGHISFLRRRKPSFLIAEDARSFGIINTPGLNFGGLFALEADGVTVNLSLTEELLALVDAELKNNFSSFYKVFGFIDRTYLNAVSPCFDQIAKNLGQKRGPNAGRYLINRLSISRNILLEAWFSKVGLRSRFISKLRRLRVF